MISSYPMFKTSLASLVLLGSLAAPIASAVEFHFNLDFSGTKFPGIIETTPGGGMKTPVNGELLRFEVSIFGQTWTESDDLHYDNFPVIELSPAGDKVVRIDFSGANPNGAILTVDYLEGIKNSFLFDAGGQWGMGEVHVPDTGSTAALLPLALGGLIWLTRRSSRP